MKGAAVFDDVTSSALQVALSGLALRQQTVANDIANVATPGFRGSTVEFEDALRGALHDGTPLNQVGATLAASTDPAGENGNNVSLDNEMLSNVDTNLRYQLVLRALDDRFSRLHQAIKG
jgi:flagellar basal-body rod protein FlgB